MITWRLRNLSLKEVHQWNANSGPDCITWGKEAGSPGEGSGTGPILLSQATFLLAHIANNGPVPLSPLPVEAR